MEIKKGKTNRGFEYCKFLDRYDVPCSIQKSSLATEDAIWFGCDDANPRILVEGTGWQNVNLSEDILINTRMHLTRDNVKQLLPILIKFVETGEI